MNSIKTAINKIYNVIELYIPMAIFFILFILYIVMIVNRYFLYGQVGKYFELTQIAFIWCSILTASYGGRTNQHVSFGLVYDKCSQKTQVILRLIGNLIVVGTFIILLPYAYGAIRFLVIKKSNLLRIPFNIIFAPFIVFIILTIVHYATWFVRDVKVFINLRRGSK